MIVYHSRLIVYESDGNMCIPKGENPTENTKNTLEDTKMTKNEDRINKLFKELVPMSGKADSLAGELVRATARIGYRFFNDGDMVNQGYGKETCNPAARFLIAKGNAEISSLTVALWEIFSEDAYEKVLDTLEGAVADYIKQNPDLRSQPTKDMWDYRDMAEDWDDSCDEEEDYDDCEDDYHSRLIYCPSDGKGT